MQKVTESPHNYKYPTCFRIKEYKARHLEVDDKQVELYDSIKKNRGCNKAENWEAV